MLPALRYPTPHSAFPPPPDPSCCKQEPCSDLSQMASPPWESKAQAPTRIPHPHQPPGSIWKECRTVLSIHSYGMGSPGANAGCHLTDADVTWHWLPHGALWLPWSDPALPVQVQVQNLTALSIPKAVGGEEGGSHASPAPCLLRQCALLLSFLPSPSFSYLS